MARPIVEPPSVRSPSHMRRSTVSDTMVGFSSTHVLRMMLATGAMRRKIRRPNASLSLPIVGLTRNSSAAVAAVQPDMYTATRL